MNFNVKDLYFIKYIQSYLYKQDTFNVENYKWIEPIFSLIPEIVIKDWGNIIESNSNYNNNNNNNNKYFDIATIQCKDIQTMISDEYNNFKYNIYKNINNDFKKYYKSFISNLYYICAINIDDYGTDNKILNKINNEKYFAYFKNSYINNSYKKITKLKKIKM